MTIADILQGKGTDVLTVAASDSVRAAIALLAERRIGCVPVLASGQVIGIFSERDLIYRLASEGHAVLDRPVSDINANGHIFGGWVLGQMDIAGGIIAGQVARGPVATVAIEAMQFIAPILLSDLVTIYADVERRGRTSVATRIDVIASRGRERVEVKVTSGLFTYVALDANHKPKPLPEA